MKQETVKQITYSAHKLMNESVIETANIIGEAHFVVKLDEALKARGLNQKQLAEMTGMRLGTVSFIVNGKGISLNKVQLFAIMSALRITDFTELLDMRLPEDIKEKFDRERETWITTGEMPEDVREMFIKNVLRGAGLEG